MTCRGQRVVYTTPLKALSNQKLFEMRLRFGASRVGLQTGDATLNVDRDIVVMTTEILRNIMYRTEPGTEGGTASSLSTRADYARPVCTELCIDLFDLVSQTDCRSVAARTLSSKAYWPGGAWRTFPHH